MDVADPSLPAATANTTSASTSSSTSRPAVATVPNPAISSAQPMASRFGVERPRWDRMHRQLLCLPANVPHCLPYIIDEAVSMVPEEAQSTIQGRGACTIAYF